MTLPDKWKWKPKVHHVNGCRQSKRKEHRHGLPIGAPGVEWWNKREGTTVRVLGPKPGCVEDWDLVTCQNCLAKREKGS